MSFGMSALHFCFLLICCNGTKLSVVFPVAMLHLTSDTGCRALRLLASPGKSGSAFFLSDDDRFLIKTVQQEEMRLLLELIPKYYRHVEENSGTLLTRFHGLHMVKPVGGAKSRVSSLQLVHDCETQTPPPNEMNRVIDV